MNTQPEIIKAARTAAADIVAQAQVELIKAAADIAEKHSLPDGVNGLSAGEFLGRLSFVASMSRDLRRAGEEHIATEAIKIRFSEEPAQTPDSLMEGEPETIAQAAGRAALDADVSELEIMPMTVKALKQAGIHQIRDIGKFTDEALLKIRGIAPPSLQRVRQAVGEYEQKHGNQ